MLIRNESDIIRLVKEDAWMMGILASAAVLQLPDWWVCAGFVRSKIWDVQHGYTERTPLQDIDVIYYDRSELHPEDDQSLEARLKQHHPGIPWSVKNQARMHKVNDLKPYRSSTDSISKFPETATALGLSLREDGEVILNAPYGVEDVLQLVVRPSPYFAANPHLWPVYEKRIATKNWQTIWTGLRVLPAGKR